MSRAVFDLHCDTAYMLQRDRNILLRKNVLHFDLERAAKMPGYAQCFACFTSDLQDDPRLILRNEINVIKDQIDANQDMIALAFSSGDVLENRQNHKISAILTLEGSCGFSCDSSRLDELYSLGFRMVSLGWNEQNILTGSHLTGGGLTQEGREFVRKAQALKMMVDVSHISDRAFWDILSITDAPIIASHSNSRKVCPASRNLTDEMFLELSACDGVAGINLYSEFLGKSASLESVYSHIAHFLELDPLGQHICLGADMDGCDSLPAGFRGVEDYPSLSDYLSDRGIPDEILDNIFWNNAIGVMEQCCM